MNRLGTHAREEIRRQMAGRRGAEARTLARALANGYGCSVGNVYSITADVRPSRKTRTDAGVQEIALTPEAETAFQFLVVAKGMSTPEARAWCEESGHRMPSVSWLNRELLRKGLSSRENEKDLVAAVRFEGRAVQPALAD